MTEISFRSDMGVALVDHMGDDRSIAQAARVSTAGLDNDRDKYVGLVRALMREQHWSPFEACTVSIAFDVPMFVRDQIVRHKSLSFSVFSLRYSEARPEFWVPADERPLVQVGKALDYRRERGTDLQKSVAHRNVKYMAASAWAMYEETVSAGIANEVARAVLPASLYTQMWATGSLRSWLHFIAARNEKHAQHEVQEVGAKVETILKVLFPVAVEAFRERE